MCQKRHIQKKRVQVRNNRSPLINYATIRYFSFAKHCIPHSYVNKLIAIIQIDGALDNIKANKV